MDTPGPDHELVEDLSKQVVGKLAPEELDLFDEMMKDYFEHPSKKTAGGGDDPLSFGDVELVTTVTPIVASVVSAALAFLGATVLGAAKDPGSRQLRERVSDRLPAATDSQSEKISLSEPQLAQLRDITRTTALRYGMDNVRAEEMTNALLVALLIGPATGPLESTKITVLFLASNPADTPQLRLDYEIRMIDEALHSRANRDRFHVEQHWAVRVSDLQELLLRHRPDIVHISGHGGETSTLLLEDANGETIEVSPEALSQLFGLLKDKLRLVILNACYSQAQAEQIATNVDAVIGMARAVDDESARRFAAAFYRALAYGQDISSAFELGLNQLQLEALPARDVPRLYAKTDASKKIRFAQI